MSKLMIIGLIVALAACPCMAINKEWSAAIGFLGGVLTTKAFDNHQHCEKVYIQQQPQQVYYVAPSGHWEYINEQIWVPGTWVYQEIGPNTYQKIWREGYYQTITKKIWVTDRDFR